MICEACHGQQTFPPCPECGGCGIAHCCDGLVECPTTGNCEYPSVGNGDPEKGDEDKAW